MKKWLIATGLLLSVGVVVTGCGQNKVETSVTQVEETPVRLGVMPSTDNIPFILAVEKEMDKKQGINLDVEVFKSALDRDAALQAGELDGVITDLAGVAIYLEGGLDVKVVGAPHDEFDLVVKDAAIQSVEDLKGQEVVFSERTGTSYAVAKMLEEVGMKKEDIIVKEIPQVPTRLELLANDQVKAAILPEPFVTIGKAQGMRVLRSTKDIGINPFAIAFTTDFVNDNSWAIAGAFDAYQEAADFIKNNDRSEYIDLFIEQVGFPENMKNEIVIPDYEAITQVKESDVQSVFEWAQAEGLTTKALQPKDVLSDVYGDTK